MLQDDELFIVNRWRYARKTKEILVFIHKPNPTNQSKMFSDTDYIHQIILIQTRNDQNFAMLFDVKWKLVKHTTTNKTAGGVLERHKTNCLCVTYSCLCCIKTSLPFVDERITKSTLPAVVQHTLK